MPGIGSISNSPLLPRVSGARPIDATTVHQMRLPKPQIAPLLVGEQLSVADISEAPRISDTHATTRTLWDKASTGDAAAVAVSVSNEPESIDWGYRDASGATLLMTALKQPYSREVIDTLLDGPARLFAGRDRNARNILHYAVDYGDFALLEKLLQSKPELSVYIDDPGRVVSPTPDAAVSLPTRPGDRKLQTPLEQAYYIHADALFAALTSTAVADIPPLRYGRKNFDAPGMVDDETLMDILPDGRWGGEQSPPHRVFSTHVRVSFDGTGSHGVAYKRLALVETAMKDRDAEPLRRLVAGMPKAFLSERREMLVKSVFENGHFPSVRVVANHYQEELFSPRADGATVLHLAAEKCDGQAIDWLFSKFKGLLNLTATDGDGRTPLLRAAHHQNRDGMLSLLARYPNEPMTDVDESGRGLLLTLLIRRAEDAATVVERPHFLKRITRDDINVTLAQAIDYLVEDTNLNSAFSLSPADANANMRIVRALLSLPPGNIDIERTIVSTGKSLSETMKSRRFIHGSALIAAHDRAHSDATALPATAATKPLSATVASKKKRLLVAAAKSGARPPSVLTESAEAPPRRGKTPKKSSSLFSGLLAKVKPNKNKAT